MVKIRIIRVYILLFLSIFLVGCGTISTSNNVGINEQNSFHVGRIRVGMLVSGAGLRNGSFNYSAYSGLMKAKDDMNIEFQILECRQESDFYTHMYRISQNSDVVIAIGYEFKDAVDIFSKQNLNVKYVIVDEELNGSNIYNIKFREEEGSFLAGVLAGLYTKTNKVGFIGGVDNDISKKHEVGFIAGVKSVNLEAGKLLEEGITSEYIGNLPDHSEAYEISKSIYDYGVDIIYYASEYYSTWVFEAAKETGSYVIGVNQNQLIDLSEYSSTILTSVVKSLDFGIYDFIKKYLDNGFKSETVEFGIKEYGIYLYEDMQDKIPQNILNKVEEFKNKIISNEIVVPKTINALKGFSF